MAIGRVAAHTEIGIVEAIARLDIDLHVRAEHLTASPHLRRAPRPREQVSCDQVMGALREVFGTYQEPVGIFD